MREEEDTTRGKRDFLLLQFFPFFLGGSVFFYSVRKGVLARVRTKH